LLKISTFFKKVHTVCNIHNAAISDGNVIIDAWTTSNATESTAVNVASDKIATIEVEYFERQGGAKLKLDIIE